MTGPPEGAAAAASARPWWVPLLGVGSMGLGGVQFLVGGALAFLGANLEGPAAGVFFGLGFAWIVPGAVLAASGAAVVLGAGWARALSLAAVGTGAIASGLVFVHRAPLPTAAADAIEFASNHPEARTSPLAGTLLRLRKGKDGDPVAVLRDPAFADETAWTYAGACGCPALPWYLVLVVACAGPAGRRIARR